MTVETGRYRPEIDGLRAVAVVPVVLFHAGFGLFGGGFVGVDVFFVISGYLITAIILRELAEDRFSLFRFYERRARRILPALTVVVGTCILFAWLWVIPTDMDEIAESILAVCFFVSNFFFWQESEYFDQGSSFEPLLHTWSLAVEEQFYLLFPPLLILLWKSGRERIHLVLVGIFAASLCLSVVGASVAPEASFFLLPSRAWELAIGALLAFHGKDGASVVDRKWHGALALAGLALIALAVFGFDETTPFPSFYALVPTVGAALVIAFASPATWAGRLLANSIPVTIGLVSYSAYLWHQPVFEFGRYLAVDPLSGSMLMLLAVLSFGLAYVTWRVVEQPFRNPAWVGRPALFATAGASGAVFLAFCAATYPTQGFLAIRLDEAQETLLHNAARSDMRDTCHVGQGKYKPPAQGCSYHSPNPSWAVVGNSHAVELADQMASRLRSVGDGVKHLTISSCRPALVELGAEEPNCVRWTADTLDYLLRKEDIRNVVLSYRTNDLAPRDSAVPRDYAEQRLRQVADAYFAIARKLAEGGKRVFLVLQAPIIRQHIQRVILDLDSEAGTDFVYGVDRERWERSQAPLRDRLKQLPREVVLVDPAELFCRAGTCAAIMVSKPLYYDNSHMSLAGAGLVADEILRQAALPAMSRPFSHITPR